MGQDNPTSASNVDRSIRCYVDPSYHRTMNEEALELARLTLRSNITGRIEIEEWKTIILDWLDRKREELEREADFINREARERVVSVTS